MDKKLFEGKWIEVNENKGWEYASRKNNAKVVSCIAYTPDNNRLILVKQFRKPLNKYVIEFPAGLVDKENESIDESALRELEEETGYKGIVEEIIGPMAKSAGLSNETLYTAIIRCYDEGEQNLQDEEDIEVIEVDINDGNEIEIFIEDQENKKVIFDSNVRLYLQQLMWNYYHDEMNDMIF